MLLHHCYVCLWFFVRNDKIQTKNIHHSTVLVVGVFCVMSTVQRKNKEELANTFNCHNNPIFVRADFALGMRCFFKRENKSVRISGMSIILLSFTSPQHQSRIMCLSWSNFKLSATENKITKHWDWKATGLTEQQQNVKTANGFSRKAWLTVFYERLDPVWRSHC